MLSKLRSGAYGEVTTAFKEDVELVFSNACLYNKPETQIYKMAVKVKEHFDKPFNAFQERLKKSAMKVKNTKTPIATSRTKSSAIDSSSKSRETSTAKKRKRASGKRKRSSTGGKSGGGSRSVNNRAGTHSTASNAEMDFLKRQLAEMQAKIDSLAQASTPAPAKKKTKKGPRPLTFEEKRVLSEQINELPPEKLTRVLHIISESMPISKTDDVDEIEVDIDSMDTKTLRKLQRFVRSALVPKKKNPSAYKDRAAKIAAEADAEIKAIESRMGGGVVAKDSSATSSKLEMMDSSSGSSSEDEEILQNGTSNPYSSYY